MLSKEEKLWTSSEVERPYREIWTKLERWAIISYMKLNKSKWWIFYLWWGNPGYMYKLGEKNLESSFMEKQERVWIDGKLHKSRQCPASQEGNWIVLGSSSTASAAGQEKWLSVFELVQPHLKFCVQVWELSSRSVSSGRWSRGWKIFRERLTKSGWCHLLGRSLSQCQHWEEKITYYT